jgi:quercetin dioxygenase-like cupin family protein
MSSAQIGKENPCDLKFYSNESEANSTLRGERCFVMRYMLVPWLLLFVLASAAAPIAAWAQAKPVSRAPAVSITPVSRDSVTIAGEPELYLNTPDPEVTSVIFTFPPGSVSQWMTHPAPAYVYVLEGTLVVEFEDGSHQSFHAGQAFLQCRSKWHRGRNDGSQTMRFLAVFVGAKGVPNVIHPPTGALVDASNNEQRK